MNACGSEVCVRDPKTIAQSSDPRFAQQNPRITGAHSNGARAHTINSVGHAGRS